MSTITAFFILGPDKGVYIAVTQTYSNHSRLSRFMAAIISQITALFLKSIPNFHDICTKQRPESFSGDMIRLVKTTEGSSMGCTHNAEDKVSVQLGKGM